MTAEMPYQLPSKYRDVVALTPGKNGDVFRARNVFLGRDVFLKAYPISKDDILAAIREPYVLTALDHENLVKVYDADMIDAGRQMLLEMEFVPGGSLQDLIDRALSNGRWPGLHRVLSFAIDICAGLSHLHARNHVHRDLKPANIMLRASPSGFRAVVTDLGLASRLGEAGRAFASRHARLYRPPEVWQECGYSQASDVYQVGIILYQLLGGTVSYALGQMPDEVLKECTVKGELFRLETLGLHAPQPVERLVKECLCEESARLKDTARLSARLQKCRVECANWAYRVDGDQRFLRLNMKDREHALQITSTGSRHRIEHRKRSGGGNWRKVGKPILVKSKCLRSCRRLCTIIKSCQ